MLEKLRAWTLSLAEGPQARRALAVVAFAESSFFPVPPDLLLFPMTLQAPRRAWSLATLCTVASVAGGAFGYLLGFAFYESVGAHIVAFYGYEEMFEQFAALYGDYGIWIILVAGFTPIPYKVFTIASGIAALNLPLFIGASLIGRGARFFLVCWLTRQFGVPIRPFLERQFGWLCLAVMLVALALLMLVRPLLHWAA